MYMKKQVIGALLLAGMLLLNGCGSSSQTDSSSAASPSSAAESSSAADSSSAAESSKADISSEPAPKYDYVHGADGYYNMFDELKNVQLKIQQAGTCWLYAARASMQTAYEKATGKTFEIEINDMLEAVYGDGKQEGLILSSAINKADIGGYQQFVTDRLSRESKNGITLDSTQIIDPTDREAIKNAVRTRGGVTIGIDSQNCQAAMFGNYPTANYKQAKVYDHVVTIVGYDDHFPKEYFSVPAEQDGAWIVYNSNLGEKFQYISYCSPLEYAISHTVSDKYSEVLSYDAGNTMNSFVTTGGSTKVANVFHKKGKLAAVGTFNNFDKQDIKIEIMSADFMNVLHTQDATLDYYGYQTIELTKPVDVEDFAVVITYSKGASVEGETISTPAFSYKTSVEKGQSFVFADGKWKDMSDSDIKTAVKTDRVQYALNSDTGAWKNYLTDGDIQQMTKTDFAPNNCCIKALYIK